MIIIMKRDKKRKKRRTYTPEEIAIILDKYNIVRAGVISEELGRTRNSIISKANLLKRQGFSVTDKK